HPAAQVPGLGRRTIVEEVNEVTAGRFQRCVALGGGLCTACHNDIQPIGGVIQSAAAGNGFDLGLVGASSNQHRNTRHVLVHARRLKSGAGTSKCKSTYWL